MERKPKPDLDEVFNLYGEDPEEVSTTLVESDADEEIDRAEAEEAQPDTISDPGVEGGVDAPNEKPED